MPPFDKVRMPPAIDPHDRPLPADGDRVRHQLQAQLGEFWDANRGRTGVILGTSAPPAPRRCTQAALHRRGRPGPARRREAGRLAHLEPLLGALREEVKRLVRRRTRTRSGDEAQRHPCRIANYFDLNGLNMTVDTGVSSALAAVQVGIGYCAAASWRWRSSAARTGTQRRDARASAGRLVDDDLAEGTFILALTTEDGAREAGLPNPRVRLEGPAEAPNGDVPVVDCSSAAAGRPYLGAEWRVVALQALQTGRETVVTCGGPSLGAPPATITVSPPVAAETAASGTTYRWHCARAVPRNGRVRARQPLEVEGTSPCSTRSRSTRSGGAGVLRPTPSCSRTPELLESVAGDAPHPLDRRLCRDHPGVVAEALEGREFRHIRVVADLARPRLRRTACGRRRRRSSRCTTSRS
jgi:hypothetical protein